MATIITKVEAARGCGYRKKGGIYFVSDGRGKTCFKLPIELTVCPCCGSGIKFSRGFTWITGALFESAVCNDTESMETDLCFECPLSDVNAKNKFGLLWVGEKFYSPEEFAREANQRGISKRIAAVPNGFKVGETWIVLAHISAVKRNAPVIVDGKEIGSALHTFPGIFHAFKPSRIEYVIEGNETEEKLNQLEKRGFTLINVVRDIDTQTKIEPL